MKNPIQTLLVLALIICGAGWFFSSRAYAAQREALEALADANAKRALVTEGFVSEFAEVRDGMLTLADSSKALEEALRTSQSRRYARTEIVTEVRYDTLVVADSTPSATYFEATVEHDPISGKVSFNLPTREFGLTLTVTPRVEQYIVQSASDRLLIGVRALSPGTEVRVEAFDATPYLQPRDRGGDSWLKRGLIFVGGMLTWELVR